MKAAGVIEAKGDTVKLAYTMEKEKRAEGLQGRGQGLLVRAEEGEVTGRPRESARPRKTSEPGEPGRSM